MKKFTAILLVISLMLALLPVAVFAHTADDPFVTDLTAGGGNIKSAKDVGDVKVWNDGEHLFVEYVVTDDEWCLVETHLEVATSLEDIPQRNGNPPPGKFSYKGEHDCVAEVTYSIPLSWEPGTELVIAAHGVVQTGGINGLGALLPDQVTMATMFPGLAYGTPSYFDVAISGGTMLDGMYDAYCVDADRGRLVEGIVNVYSSYEPLPPSVPIEYPENLDLVNWIINQGFEGQPSGCDGNYTYGDVQWAIWQLLEDNPPVDHQSLSDWSPCRAQEILSAAYANGEGYVPGCGELMGIILDPVEWRQPVIIWVGVPCVKEETVWGGDYFGTPLEFPGENWAIYLTYTVQVNEPSEAMVKNIEQIKPLEFSIQLPKG